MYKNKIHFYKSIDNLNLRQRSEMTFELLSVFAEVSNHKTWTFSDKMPIDLSDKQSSLKHALDILKSRIKKNTTLDFVSDDHLDSSSTILSFYGSQKMDNGVLIQAIITSEEVEFIIFNYEELFDAVDLEAKDALVSSFHRRTSLALFDLK